MRRPRVWLFTVLILLIIGGIFIFPAYAQSTPPRDQGYWYVVRRGDSWWSISARTGVPVSVLQQYNPQAIHPNLWLYTGEKIWIPTGQTDSQRGYWYVVRPGDTWLGLAIRTGVPVEVLKRLNPHAIHPNDWMWVGDRIFIPTGPVSAAQPTPSAGTPVPAATATPAPAETPAPAATEVPPTATPVATSPAETSPLPTPAATPTAVSTPLPTRPPTPTPAGEVTPLPPRPPTPTPSSGGRQGEQSTPTPVPVDVPCPEEEQGLDQVLTRVVDAAGGDLARVTAWLQACGLSVPGEEAVAQADVDGNGQPDLLFALTRENPRTHQMTGTLLLFTREGEALQPLLREQVDAAVRVLAFRDVNGDGRTDVVWREDVCGPVDCTVTVHVQSWDPQEKKLVPFSDGVISMVNADVWLEDVDGDGAEEIVLHGGIIKAIGAGPQRAWKEIWDAKGGKPYELVARVYDPSPCLYHWVLDGNHALEQGDVEKAIQIFQQVVSNPELTACWLRPAEEEELRSFGWFRLALAYAYAGRPDQVESVVHQAEQAYPDALYIQALKEWYRAYAESQDPQKACEALQPFIESHPDLWKMLAHYGFANPTFGPADVCPTSSSRAGQTTPVTTTDTSETTPTPAPTAAGESGSCPKDLEEVSTWAQRTLTQVKGDILALYEATRQCGLTGDAYGGVGGHDVDGDGDEDVFLALDLPLHQGMEVGPGAVLAFHRQGDDFSLKLEQLYTGTVTLLAVEDLNQDGQVDVVWQEMRCRPEEKVDCTLTVQVYSWTGEDYVVWVQGEPQGHNARVEFADEAPGSGQEILIRENVYSDAPTKEPERVQVWASDGGAPYSLFDVMYPDNTCARYALHAAWVALQGAPTYGWDRAVERFAHVFSGQGLTACKPGGDAEEELATVRSFAGLELAIAASFAGNGSLAKATLDTLDQELPDAPFTPLAHTWWDAYSASGDARAACQAVVQALQEKPDLLALLGGYPVDPLPPQTPEDVCPE